MSLDANDEKRIVELFEKKAQYEMDSDGYVKYRNEIITDALTKLDDYFSVLKREWQSKFNISADDGVSIIHDGLFSAVDSFKTRPKKAAKFLTYLSHILKNKVKNFITLNYMTDIRSKRRVHKLLRNCCVSLDTMISKDSNDDSANHSFIDKQNSLIFEYLVDESEKFDVNQNQKFYAEHILSKLSGRDREIVKYVLDGYNLKEIARIFNLSSVSIKNHLKKVAQKFPKIKETL